jgi:hypothetical protein
MKEARTEEIHVMSKSNRFQDEIRKKLVMNSDYIFVRRVLY